MGRNINRASTITDDKQKEGKDTKDHKGQKTNNPNYVCLADFFFHPIFQGFLIFGYSFQFLSSWKSAVIKKALLMPYAASNTFFYNFKQNNRPLKIIFLAGSKDQLLILHFPSYTYLLTYSLREAFIKKQDQMIIAGPLWKRI